MANYIIGFANKFFTLWTVSSREVSDSLGMTKIVDYTYIKNVSFNEDVVRKEYPNVEIDMNLKGHSSFQKTERIEDSTKFQYGKYRGDIIADSIDYSYMMWYYNDGCSTGNKAEIEKVLVPEGYVVENGYMVSPTELAERKRYTDVQEANIAKFDGNPVMVVPTRNLYEDGYLDYMDGILIKFQEYSVLTYNGYPYALPTIKGKSKRIKNKNVNIIDYTVAMDKYNRYIITVNKFEIVK